MAVIRAPYSDRFGRVLASGDVVQPAPKFGKVVRVKRTATGYVAVVQFGSRTVNMRCKSLVRVRCKSAGE